MFIVTKCYILVVQYFDTVRSALASVSTSHSSSRSGALVLIHGGTYRDEFLVVDTDCTVIGSGKVEF
jgi:hypothetical protein